MSKINAEIPQILKNSPFIILSVIYFSTAAIVLTVWQEPLQLALLAKKAAMTIFALKFLMAAAGAIALYILFKLIKAAYTPRIVWQEISKSPITHNPVRAFFAVIANLLGFLKNQAERNPYIMMVFGLLFIMPSVILMMHFYGNVIFAEPINWLLQNIFLPTANGLVNPLHAHWLAALATGFLYAKVFFIIAESLVNQKKSIAYTKIWTPFIEHPIINSCKIIGLLILTKILTGVSFLSHLSGSWLIFNLLAIMIKVVSMLYDIVESGSNGIFYKLVMFPIRFLKKLLTEPSSLLVESWKEIKIGFFEVTIAPFSMIIWPVLKTYMTPFFDKNSFTNIQRKGTSLKKFCKIIISKISFKSFVALVATIYSTLPLVNLIVYHHLNMGIAFNWYNQFLLALQVKTSASILGLVAAIAIFCVGILSVFTSKSSLRSTYVLVLFSDITIISLASSSMNLNVSSVVTYSVIIAISACFLNFLYLQSKWLYTEAIDYANPSQQIKGGDKREKRRTETTRHTTDGPTFKPGAGS